MEQEKRKIELNNSNKMLQDAFYGLAFLSTIAGLHACVLMGPPATIGFACLAITSKTAGDIISRPSATMKPYRDTMVESLTALRKRIGLDNSVAPKLDATDCKKMGEYLIDKAKDEFPEHLHISATDWPVIDPFSQHQIDPHGEEIVVLVPNDAKCTSYHPTSLSSVLAKLSETGIELEHTKEVLFTNHLGNRVDLSKTITVTADAFQQHFNPDYSPSLRM